MRRATSDLIAWFTGRQHGVVARWQLLEAGVSTRAIEWAVESGALIPIQRGVYRLRGAPVTKEMRWHAATLAVGADGLLSRRAAAALHGLDGIRRSRPEVTGPYSRLPLLDGADAHRSRRLTEHDRTVVDGIPVTTVARTLLDCAGVLPYDKVEHATHQAIIRKQVGQHELWVVIDRVCGRGVPGSTAIKTIAAGDATDATIQSALELVLKRIVDRCRIPATVRQHAFTCSDGRQVVLDTYIPEAQVAVEADGLRWHGTAKQLRDTRARSRSIQNSGVLHLAYGWADCHEAADEVRREVERAVLERIRRAA